MKRGNKMLMDLQTKAKEMNVPYQCWNDIDPALIVDAAQGLFKQIYRVRGNNDLVVQNFKEMDAESSEQRVREVACLLKLRDLKGVGQIQSLADNQEGWPVYDQVSVAIVRLRLFNDINPRDQNTHLVSLLRCLVSRYPYTLKQMPPTHVAIQHLVRNSTLSRTWFQQ
jgi:hypothetical protein